MDNNYIKNNSDIETITPTCPLCNKNDSIQRLSEMASGNKFLVGPKNLSADFSNVVSLPLEPQKPKGFGFWWIPIHIYGIYLFLAFGISFFTIILATEFSILLKLVPQDFNPDNIQSEYFTEPFISYVLLGVLVLDVLLSIALSSILIAIYYYVFRKLNTKKRDVSEKRYAKEKSAWDKAKIAWKQFYYCSRDNIFFEPNISIYLKPNKLSRHLFYIFLEGKEGDQRCEKDLDTIRSSEDPDLAVLAHDQPS